MSTDDVAKDTIDQTFSDNPDPSKNEGYLDKKLNVLQERYSYERLSDLSARRLGAIDLDEEGMSERDFLHQDFKELYKRFPGESSDHKRRRWALGDDYQGLAPLTLEQKQRIHDCHHECSRNLDRARQDALEREDLAGPLSRFATWLIDFVDAATPVVSIQR